MEVVFTQDVLNQARAGEIKTVADGFARNYLIPQGLAQVATPEVLKRLHKIKAAGDETRIQETKSMEELASALDDTTVTITARVTPTGRYYGAITSTRIASELASGRWVERSTEDFWTRPRPSASRASTTWYYGSPARSRQRFM